MASAKSSSATNNKSHSAPATIKAINQKLQSGLPYLLYKHRDEVKKRNSPLINVAHTKLNLTHLLITKAMKNIGKCLPNDLQILNREKIFAKNLMHQIERVNKYKFMQMAQHAQQRKQHLLKLSQQQKRRLSQPQQKRHHEDMKDIKGSYNDKAENIPKKIKI